MAQPSVPNPTYWDVGKDVAFLFGAGASMPHLLPQRQLVPNLLSASHPRLGPARAYLKRVFPGLTPSSAQSVNYEDVVGPLEIAETTYNWFHFVARERDEDPFVTNREVLDSLDTWLAMALEPDPKVIPRPPTRKSSQDEVSEYLTFYRPAETAKLTYARLVHFLQTTCLLENTVFLSMNYDLLLDRCLNVLSDYAPDYQIDLFQHRTVPTSKKLVSLLKLHGSLNWQFCDWCHALDLLGDHVVWAKAQCHHCRRPNARPLLIRPTLLKDFHYRVWHDAWRLAGRALASAGKWIVVGYSFPLADVWLLRILIQALRSGAKARDREIIIVNSNPEAYERFLLVSRRARFRRETFDDWVSSCFKAGDLAG